MKCENCSSLDVNTWASEGDSGYKCNRCGQVVENNILTRKGRSKRELYYYESGDLPIEENYHRIIE